MLPNETVIGYLSRCAELRAHDNAFVFLENGERVAQRISYAKLMQRASNLANWLLDRGAKDGRVLLIFPPGIDFIVAYYGCLMAQAVAVPVAPMLNPKMDHRMYKTKAVIEDCAPTLILGSESTLGHVVTVLADQTQYAAGRNIIDLASLDLSGSDVPRWQYPESDALAMLQYTSGSTSLPKGVMLSHANLAHNVRHFDELWGHDEHSRLVCWLPHFHDFGLIYGLLLPIYKGIECVLLPPAAITQKPIRWLKAISDFKGTHSMGPNFMYELCLQRIKDEELRGVDLSSWRATVNAAEPVRAQTVRQFNARFAQWGLGAEVMISAYGLAEAACRVTGQRIGQGMDILPLDVDALAKNQVVLAGPQSSTCLEVVGCGYPALETEIVIVNPATRLPCGAAEVGEVWIRSGSVANGYWNRPEVSVSTFGASLAALSETKGYLRSGDLGFLHAGQLFITGRIKDVVIIRGENYYPHDLEKTAEAAHESLRKGCCAVFGVELDGEEGVVVVQEIRDGVLAEQYGDIFQSIRKAISRAHDLPVSDIVLIPAGAINKTSSGKIQRSTSRAAYQAGQLSILAQLRQPSQVTAEVPVADKPAAVDARLAVGLEAFLIEQIARATKLPLAQIDRDAPFADLGLGSLESTQLSADLSSYLGSEVSPTVFYDYPSIRLLVAALVPVAPQVAASGHSRADDDIAIIGMSCRFPQARGLDQYWSLLSVGGSGLSVRSDLVGGQGQVRQAGYVQSAAHFDHDFFNISKREADAMDIQQRMALEVSWEALEQAGLDPKSLAGSDTGVFIGASAYDYGLLQLSVGEPDAYTAQGSVLAVIANRLSYYFDFRGPSFVVDTACSSALTALHQACHALRRGECQLALSGGVSSLLADAWNVVLDKAGMLSPDGVCKTFDAQANGYVRGEGCGMVVLKRYQDALRDGDPIMGVILSTALNQDGRSNGLTAPNGQAQAALLTRSIEQAGIEPHQIGYFEAHGTGTSLGDPIECNTLARVLARPAEQPCYIGSVKANIGHLEAAAGIAGLIKVVLCLQKQQIPPQPHFQTLNPLIQFNGALEVPTRLLPWVRQTEQRRIAALNAFGFSGGNANVIVAEAASAGSAALSQGLGQQRMPHIGALPLVLTGTNAAALTSSAEAYLQALSNEHAAPWQDIAYSACERPRCKGARAVLVSADSEELAEQLARVALQSTVEHGVSEARRDVVLVFTGQGMPLFEQGVDLYRRSSHFRRLLDVAGERLRQRLGVSVIELLSKAALGLLDGRPSLTQPVHFCLQYALAETLKVYGVEASTVAGHSLGEYAAWCYAGCLSFEDALDIVIERGRLCDELGEDGGMLALQASREETLALLKQAQLPLDLAVVNHRAQCVVAGQMADLAEFEKRFLAPCELHRTALNIRRAYHSRYLTDAASLFRAFLQRFTLQPPTKRVVSSINGQVYEPGQTPDKDYFVHNLRSPVRFDLCLDRLSDLRHSAFLEVGTKPTLAKMARLHLPQTAAWSCTLQADSEDWRAFLVALKELDHAGSWVDWLPAFVSVDAQKTAIPAYYFQGDLHRFTVKSRAPQQTPSVDLPIPAGSVLADAVATPMIDLQPLVAPAAAEQSGSQSAWSSQPGGRSSQLAERLRLMLSQLLRCPVERLVDDKTFLELGVDSIVMMEFTRLASRELGIEIRLTELVRHAPTVGRLAVYLEAKLAAPLSASVMTH